MTVRGVDARLERVLRAEARRRGLSVNRTVLGLLHDATGLRGDLMDRDAPARFEDLDHLAGTWTPEEAAAFDRYVRSLRGVDAELLR
jgi:hypothetical protein